VVVVNRGVVETGMEAVVKIAAYSVVLEDSGFACW
jgi:hypothetical protein